MYLFHSTIAIRVGMLECGGTNLYRCFSAQKSRDRRAQAAREWSLGNLNLSAVYFLRGRGTLNSFDQCRLLVGNVLCLGRDFLFPSALVSLEMAERPLRMKSTMQGNDGMLQKLVPKDTDDTFHQGCSILCICALYCKEPDAHPD